MQPSFRTLEQHIGHLSGGDQADIKRAFEFAEQAHSSQLREDGSPYLSHLLAVAEIVADWHADRDTLIAALLHDVLEDTPVTKDQLIQEFGRRAALLVEGITKFTQADLDPDLPLDRKIETVRKLFDVMRLDMRSIVIKLADRLHNVQTIASLPTPERRRKFALETLTIYYRVAYHLGMRELRHTFAEYCVPHAYPSGVSERDRRDSLCQAAHPLPEQIAAELRRQGSPPITSITLLPRNLQLFHERVAERLDAVVTDEDAFTITVIVSSEDDCYALLKSLHTLYRPVSGKFRDYVAAPSDAGYQSLHACVTLLDGRVIEVRIRTPEMEEQVQRGVTLSLFSKHSHQSPSFGWLQKSATVDLTTRDSSSAFWEALESDVLRETISVTVDRSRISVPRGSTVLDAAYALYGSRAGFAKAFSVSGRTAPIGTVLTDDADLHVAFDPTEQVTVDWLQQVTTSHARTYIVEVLKRMSRAEKVSLGALLLQKELDHFSRGLIQDLSRTQCQHLADHYRRKSFDDVLAMIAEGVLRGRDAVFILFPDRDNRREGRPDSIPGRYHFRLSITGRQPKQQDVFPQFASTVRMAGVVVDHSQLKFDPTTGQLELWVTGSADDRLQFADFVDALERQDWTSSVQALISGRQKLMLVGAFVVAFAVMALDFVFYPVYQQAILSLPILLKSTVQALPLLPILGANYYVLRLLRHYVARMRSDRWFLGLGFLLNCFGLLLLITRILLSQGLQVSLFPLAGLFTLSLLYIGFKFFQTDALFAHLDARHGRQISDRQWSVIRRRKIAGYVIRFLAVIVWGLEPIYIRYTAVNDLSPFLRTFLLGIGALVPCFLIYVIRQTVVRRRLPSLQLPYNLMFGLLVFGQVGHMYFKNASLIYTSGTNLLLFNNFAPVIGLLIAAFLSRRQIPYFKQPKTMLWIFLLSLSASIGSALLVYNSAIIGSKWTVTGDVLALISTVFDVFLVIGQIEYIKRLPRTDGLLLNIHIFLLLLMFISPLIVVGHLLGFPLLVGLTRQTFFLGLGIGLFVGFGQLLNYEAFKRIDGYLAYMMFNFSILITFVIEAFLIRSIHPTWFLALSAVLIIGGSVLAEVVSSKCEKQGL